MIRKTRLFTPGPTPLLPAAQFAMAAADIHHRTPEFRALFKRVLEQLKAFVGTQNDVVVLSSSGTGAMEAAVSNIAEMGTVLLPHASPVTHEQAKANMQSKIHQFTGMLYI